MVGLDILSILTKWPLGMQKFVNSRGNIEDCVILSWWTSLSGSIPKKNQTFNTVSLDILNISSEWLNETLYKKPSQLVGCIIVPLDRLIFLS